MLVLDGNNSLKRIARVGQRDVADRRVYTRSDYFLSRDFVDTFTRDNAIPVVNKAPAPPVGDPEDNQEHEDITEEYRVDSACANNWKAASGDEHKHMWELFDETGIFACACRHGFVLWLADMVRSGEL